MEQQRLSKRLAAAGVASRRASEELIFAGRVFVNGRRAEKPEERVGPKDKVTVDGASIKTENKVYYVLNKPRGLICSSVGAKSILTILPQDKRLFTVGRLDRDTTGLLLVTNDGTFAQKVIHPSAGHQKEYVVKVRACVTGEHLEAMSRGRWIEGRFVKPVSVHKIRRGTCRIVIKEGKKHEVRLLVQSAGLEVAELKRTRIGSLLLGTLPEGGYRMLSEKEKQALLDSHE